MTKIMNRLISKLIFIVMLTFVVALGAVAMNVPIAPQEEGLDTAHAFAGSGVWRNTITSAGTYWLNNYCRYADWYTGWSSGGSGDYSNTDTQLYIDQGGSDNTRWGIHQITLNFSAELAADASAYPFNYTFEADVHAANPDYNTLTFILEYINSAGTVVRTRSMRVWGENRDAPDQGKGSTDTAAYRYITDTTSGIAYNKVRITIRTDKRGTSIFNLRHMDLFARNMRITIVNNRPEEYFAGYVGYSSYSGTGSLNVFNKNLSNGGGSGVIGTTLAAISTNGWCPPMQNSSSTGSAAFLTRSSVSVSDFSFSTPTAAVSVSSTGYSTAGQHTPAAGIVAPSIGAVSVSDFSAPGVTAAASGTITTVPTDRGSYTAPSPSSASAAANGPNITMTAFSAKQPADAYRWKNPLTLTGGASLSNTVSQSYSDGWDYWLINKWKRWTISSSGTLPHEYVTQGSGATADQMEIAFNTGGTDMHIIMPAGYRINFFDDQNSRIEVNGGGRVFIYLMGNNLIRAEGGDYFGGSSSGGYYSDGTPNLYFIAIGGNITFDIRRIQSRFAVYAPHGQLAPQNAGRNNIYFNSDNNNHEMRGIVVADHVSFTRDGSNASYRFYKSGLPNTIRFGGVDRPLSFFMDAPETTNANYNWTNVGTIFG